MRRSRSFRFALFLALLSNALGSPMALAHWLGGGMHDQATLAADVTPECHGQEAPSSDDAGKSGAMPCCDGGGCSCVAGALVVCAAVQSAEARHPPASVPSDTLALPASPLDDSLRPPIA